MSRKRKQHSAEDGYISERMNPFVPGTKVVIYNAREQDLDDVEGTYAVVCDAHGTVSNTWDIYDARELMKAPENFCDACRILKTAGQEV